MQFDILTLFPEMFSGPLTESIIKRAVQAGYISIGLHNIRDYATDRHRTTDDAPYGGGAGMVMKAEPLAAAIRAVTAQSSAEAGLPARPHVILLTPAGEQFSQPVAETLAGYQHLVLVCGRYEGVDERVVEALIDRQLSIGDYVLTGGELGAMVVLDAVARLVPGVLDEQSTLEESHSDSLLEYPHYTRPAVWEGREVPDVLLSGHHGQVAAWRHRERLRRTLERRPDMLANANLKQADKDYLQSLGWQPPA
jgi:tRNA (guanine37-N1)-methyltransferase